MSFAILYLLFVNSAIQLIVNANLTVCILTDNVHFLTPSMKGAYPLRKELIH